MRSFASSSCKTWCSKKRGSLWYSTARINLVGFHLLYTSIAYSRLDSLDVPLQDARHFAFDASGQWLITANQADLGKNAKCPGLLGKASAEEVHKDLSIWWISIDIHRICCVFNRSQHTRFERTILFDVYITKYALASQDSDNISVFRFNYATGKLDFSGHECALRIG